MERSEFIKRMDQGVVLMVVSTDGRLIEEKEFGEWSNLEELEEAETLARFGKCRLYYEMKNTVGGAYEEIATARIQRQPAIKPLNSADWADALRWLTTALPSEITDCELRAAAIRSLRDNQ